MICPWDQFGLHAAEAPINGFNVVFKDIDIRGSWAYAPDGMIDRRIGMPVRNITSVNFGGGKLDEIYVTSMARVDHPAVHDQFAVEAKPQFGAGSLFRVTGLGIRGLPGPRFGG